MKSMIAQISLFIMVANGQGIWQGQNGGALSRPPCNNPTGCEWICPNPITGARCIGVFACGKDTPICTLRCEKEDMCQGVSFISEAPNTLFVCSDENGCKDMTVEFSNVESETNGGSNSATTGTNNAATTNNNAAVNSFMAMQGNSNFINNNGFGPSNGAIGSGSVGGTFTGTNSLPNTVVSGQSVGNPPHIANIDCLKSGACSDLRVRCVGNMICNFNGLDTHGLSGGTYACKLFGSDSVACNLTCLKPGDVFSSYGQGDQPCTGPEFGCEMSANQLGGTLRSVSPLCKCYCNGPACGKGDVTLITGTCVAPPPF